MKNNNTKSEQSSNGQNIHLTTNTLSTFWSGYLQKGQFETRDESIPFQKLKPEEFIPGLQEAIQAARQQIQKIKANPASADFANTILALESAGEASEVISGVFFNLFSSEANEEFQSLAKDISPILASYSSEISLDLELFEKIKSVYDRRQDLNLNQEQIKLTEKYYKDFVRNGALLPADKKEKLKQIDQELSVLGPKFSEHILKATNAFELVITDKKDLIGLPEGSIEAAALDAEAKGYKNSWLFTLQAPSLIPFLQYAQNRELRKKMWMAYNSRAYKDAFDNQEIIKTILRLKKERSVLLGFKNYAEYILEERMAQNSNSVFQFLDALLVPSKKAAEKDLAELRDFKKSLDGNDDIKPWDFSYYAEKLKEKKYKFNEEELRPYFKLENVVEGVFEHARRLFGITFNEIFDVEKYHPDVRTFEVLEEGSGKYVGLFYTDFFPRETKKGGAWMTSYREQGLFHGIARRPHISIVCNFTKPTPSKPSLLSYDEVQTLFHEFGHALHGLLSNVTYRSLAGTSVYWDFVELPSQIFENWTKEKEGLDIFARHYQTGEAIPADLVEKLKRSQRFNAGYTSLRQLNYGYLDMHWFTIAPESIQSVSDCELKFTENTRLLPAIEGTNMSCAFGHIFGGGYSAGYYSYKWAEVLDADAFEFFKEKGLFNTEVATLFKTHILSKGATEHPMELYKKFRGREPDPQALLRRDGLV